MSEYTIKPLSPDTWDAFAALAERHNGCWNAVHGSCWAEGGGCWCMRFQRSCADKKPGEGNRARKERLVNEGRAHAALVFEGDVAVAWCEYGTPDELPNIYHRKEYLAGLEKQPDYRLTCLFVDKNQRRKGLAGAALRGALDLIAQAGGGVVEAYPQDTEGQPISPTFLYTGTRSLFEQAGFGYDRRKGRYHCVMSKKIPPG
ncbi:MAG: GNAT family N-acetyltransferase [Streptosporangiaceae bacterium]